MQKYAVFIGIDISKKWIDACPSCDGQKKDMPHRRFDNDEEGFLKMLDFVQGHAGPGRNADVWLFCMEHTGVYAAPLCGFLQGRGLHYVVESALQISRSLGIRRGKSDKADAADIARYIFLHHAEAKLSVLPSGPLLKAKLLLSLYARLKKAETALRVAARELAGFTAAALSGEVVEVTDVATRQLREGIRQVEKSILGLIKGTPELYGVYQLATSVTGVGPIIGAHLLVATNGFQSFRNGRQFACYAGLAPFGRSSGSSVRQPDRVSHLADKKLKALLSNGAASAIQHDPELKAYYQRKIAEGKNRFLVQNNVKNKLVHRVFAVVNRGTPFAELHRHAK